MKWNQFVQSQLQNKSCVDSINLIAFLFLLHFRYEDLYLDDCLEKWTDPYYMCNDFLIQLVNETAREVVMKAVGENAYQVLVLFYCSSKDFFYILNERTTSWNLL